MLHRATKAVGGFFLDIIETVVIALSIFLIVYLFIMQPHQVNGASMVPTYHDGEYLLTDKVSYKFGDPKRGDVVVFKAPEATQCPQGTGCDFIKRIVGLPGDSIEVKNNFLYVNGVQLYETYLESTTVTKPGTFTSNGPVVVPEGSYFVVGDNRTHSSDSRAWGPVMVDNIVGRVFFRYWPPTVIGLVPQADYAE